MGGLMFVLWAIRFFIFKLHESPKYLMGRGRDDLAVDIVHKVAAFNGTTSTLSIEHLQAVEKIDEKQMETNAAAAVRRKLSAFSGNHVKSLFATKKLAWSTSLLIILWGKHNSPLNRNRS